MKKPLPFAFIGLLLGIPLSYYFQPGIIQMKFTLPEYLTQLPAVFEEGNPDYIVPVVLSCVIAALVCSAFGAFIDKAGSQKQAQSSERLNRPEST